MIDNSITEIQKRVASGKIKWIYPIAMLLARSILALLMQALTTVIFFRGSAEAWNAAGEWWRVYGTVIDIVCLVMLVVWTRKENIRIFDLGTYRRDKWGRDVLIGLALFVPILLSFVVPTVLTEIILYGGSAPVPGRGLPLAGSLYALIVWPIIWAFAEDNVYFGYSLPRLEALTGHKWLAVIIVSTFTAAQHIFLPLRFEWQWLISHFIGYIIGSAVYCVLYLRWRRLLPIHISHWAINVVGIVMVLLSRG